MCTYACVEVPTTCASGGCFCAMRNVHSDAHHGPPAWTSALSVVTTGPPMLVHQCACACVTCQLAPAAACAQHNTGTSRTHALAVPREQTAACCTDIACQTALTAEQYEALPHRDVPVLRTAKAMNTCTALLGSALLGSALCGATRMHALCGAYCCAGVQRKLP